MSHELELKKLGFSDKEARVYLALLELGTAAVQHIAQKAKVNRATTYVVLEALRQRGAVSQVEHNRKVFFSAENPRVLLRIFRNKEQEIKEKQEEFKKALPELEAVFNLASEKPRIRFFEGQEGVRNVREDILQSGAKVLYDIYSFEYVEQIFALFSEAENDEFLKKRQHLGITIKSIYTGDKPFAGFKLKGERKFVARDKFPFSSDILIYGDRVAFTTLKGKILSVIIQSKEIADTMRLVFELAWIGADQS